MPDAFYLVQVTGSDKNTENGKFVSKGKWAQVVSSAYDITENSKTLIYM